MSDTANSKTNYSPERLVKSLFKLGARVVCNERSNTDLILSLFLTIFFSYIGPMLVSLGNPTSDK